MNRRELEQFLTEEGFVPFVITTLSGFSIAVKDVRQALVGMSLIVVKDRQTGMLYHIAFRAIEHVTYLGEIG